VVLGRDWAGVRNRGGLNEQRLFLGGSIDPEAGIPLWVGPFSQPGRA
jgi:hypothetical protein